MDSIHGQLLSYEEVVKLERTIPNRENSEWAQKQPYVILLSIDGFRHDYAKKYGAENMLAIMEGGVSTSSLLCSFPTKTFPNHYTLVTGMYPGNHGVVSNEFFSREKDYWYKIRDKKAVQDASWYGGTPIWVLAEQHQMLSANLFWVGSEAPIRGIMSTYSYEFNNRIANAQRIRRLLDWLALPAEKRPHMILGYFSLVDNAGHRYGPDHDKTREAVLEMDSLVGQLVKGIEQTGLPVNLILVSDHGMSAINRGLVLPELVQLQDAEVAYSFPPMIYQPDTAKRDKLYSELLEVEELEVYRKWEVPEYLHFENEDRVGDLVLLTEAPTIILDKPKVVSGGTHGFNPFNTPDMGGIFCATGPQLKSGVKLSPVENIHIYPFIAEILGLNVPDSINGDLRSLEFLLNK